MKSTIGAVILAGLVLAVPLVASLTAVATTKPVQFNSVTREHVVLPPEPGADYYDYE